MTAKMIIICPLSLAATGSRSVPSRNEIQLHIPLSYCRSPAADSDLTNGKKSDVISQFFDRSPFKSGLSSVNARP
ncbi:MAG: hypothetical protein ACXWFG_02885 [Methylobacter sp.]